MKTKNKQAKLSLNKDVLANLDSSQLNRIQGGFITGVVCVPHSIICTSETGGCHPPTLLRCPV